MTKPTTVSTLDALRASFDPKAPLAYKVNPAIGSLTHAVYAPAFSALMEEIHASELAKASAPKVGKTNIKIGKTGSLVCTGIPGAGQGTLWSFAQGWIVAYQPAQAKRVLAFLIDNANDLCWGKKDGNGNYTESDSVRQARQDSTVSEAKVLLEAYGKIV